MTQTITNANEGLLRRFLIGITAMLVLYAGMLTFSYTQIKAESLMDLFQTDAFTGSWEVFSKFNWLGMCMNYLISAFCLIGLFLVVFQRIISILYLSSRSTFDKIHEIKQSGSGKKFFGYAGLVPDVWNAKNGTGLDSIVMFLLSLLPDVKEYSDYKEGNKAYNLADTDTVTSYILKVSLPTVMLLFFFTIGFNGNLFRIYGNVVDAMATASDNFVNTKLSTYVDRLINKGNAYEFAYADDGTEFGKLKQKIAENVYTSVIKNVENPTTDAMLLIGQKIDSLLSGTNGLTAKDVSDALGNAGSTTTPLWDWEKDPSGAKNIKYNVVINGSTDKYSGEIFNQKLEDLTCGYTVGGGYGNLKNATVHVIVSKKSNSSEHDYFKRNDSTGTATGTDKNGNGGQQQAKPAQ